MKAAFINSPGSAETIQYGDLPEPRLEGDGVLVRVQAVAVNHVDTYIRSGAFPMDLPLPFVIGRDMVGVVETIGESVRNFKPGDLVWSNCLGIDGLQGTFAEFLTAPRQRLYHLPSGVDTKEVVSVLHAGLTAAIGLFTKARLAAGDSLFINGGSGSIGIAALQIAKACGARVAVTASDEKAAYCKEMGADLVVNYRRETIADAIRGFVPDGLDVFWEATPSLDLQQIVPQMAQHGRILVIAGHNRTCDLPVWQFYTRNCSIHGFTVTGASESELANYAQQINGWLESSVLKAKIDRILSLSQAAEAHRAQENENLFGKIVLVPDS